MKPTGPADRATRTHGTPVAAGTTARDPITRDRTTLGRTVLSKEQRP
ncbi:hypothetical protein [Streptomyces camponoticapitis]|nr:hypothetical protein [Streptomyces camponoticapitis]